jgi:hypothetical protein
MGDPKRAGLRMDWERTLGGMLRHGSHVVQLCKVCGRVVEVDVTALAGRLGGGASLWDYFRPCTFEDCPDGLTMVHASPGRATPLRPLSSYNVWPEANGGWSFLPKYPDQPPFMYGIEPRAPNAGR